MIWDASDGQRAGLGLPTTIWRPQPARFQSRQPSKSQKMSAPGEKRRNGYICADSSDTSNTPASKAQKTRVASTASSSSAAAASFSRSQLTRVDVFIQCGLATEASWTVQILCGQRDIAHIKKAAFDGPAAYSYHVVPLQVLNQTQEKHDVLIGVGWQPAMGPQATSSYCAVVRPQLEAWGVQLWAMSGILAGIEGQCKLGDAVVALDATSLAGKINEAQDLLPQASFSEIRSKTACLVHELLTRPECWRTYLLDFMIRDNDGSHIRFATPSSESSSVRPLPPPMRWCVLDVLHWLDVHKENTEGLSEHLDKASYSQFSEKVLERAKQAKYYEVKDGALQLTNNGAAFLHEARSQAHFGILKNRKFPREYSAVPGAVAGTVYSSEFVREDLDASTGVVKMLKVQTAQRKIVGADMEISAFYKAVKDSAISFLAVKGACDMGDAWKDDNFHAVAAEVSAAFLRAFIVEGYEDGRFSPVASQSQQRPTSVPDVQARLSASPASASASGPHLNIGSAFGSIHVGNTYNGPVHHGPVTHHHARLRGQSEAEKAAARRSAGPVSTAELQAGYNKGGYNFEPNRTESFPEEILPDFDTLKRDSHLNSIGREFDSSSYGAPFYFDRGMLKGLRARGEFQVLLRMYLKQNSDRDFYMYSGDFWGKFEDKHRERMRPYQIHPTGNVKTAQLRRDATGR